MDFKDIVDCSNINGNSCSVKELKELECVLTAKNITQAERCLGYESIKEFSISSMKKNKKNPLIFSVVKVKLHNGKDSLHLQTISENYEDNTM